MVSLVNPCAGSWSGSFVADDARAPRVSAVIACYLDAQAIPLMYQRLTDVFAGLAVDHEIIFVNDGSPDDTASVLKALTEKDDRVLAIEHSRNFGSQNAFLSGMELATGDAVVLLDGDLQDPPEVIPALYEKWREGNDVVYGRRTKREVPAIMSMAYKAFYRVFRAASYVPSAARRGRLRADGPTGRRRAARAPRDRSVPARASRLGRLQADGRRLCPPRARLRTLDPQPAEEPLVGQESHLLVQLPAHRAPGLRRRGDDRVVVGGRHLRDRRQPSSPRHQSRLFRPHRSGGVLRQPHSPGHLRAGRVPHQGLRRGQTETAVHPQGPVARRKGFQQRGRDGGLRGRRKAAQRSAEAGGPDTGAPKAPAPKAP